MIKIAITGVIGSGKSTLSQCLRNLGYPVADCDAISQAELNRQAKASSSPQWFAEVPLLFEAGMEKQFDEIITVTAPLETILQRLQQGRGLSPQQARARMAAQMSQEEKSRRSTLTIVNDGDIPAMQDQIQQWIKEKQDGTESERRIPQ